MNVFIPRLSLIDPIVGNVLVSGIVIVSSLITVDSTRLGVLIVHLKIETVLSLS